MQQQRGDFPREIIRTPQIRFQLGNPYGGDALCAVRDFAIGTPKSERLGKVFPTKTLLGRPVQPGCRRE
jgi:hypothetical protein